MDLIPKVENESNIMSIEFIHLNKDWNAEPNAPCERVFVRGSELVLEFTVNPWMYEGFSEEERMRLVFTNPSRYRLGATNDEGWDRGQCRFGTLAPKWGEFYLLEGKDSSVKEVDDWVELKDGEVENHYLFYLRDSTFECFAAGVEIRRKVPNCSD